MLIEFGSLLGTLLAVLVEAAVNVVPQRGNLNLGWKLVDVVLQLLYFGLLGLFFDLLLQSDDSHPVRFVFLLHQDQVSVQTVNFLQQFSLFFREIVPNSEGRLLGDLCDVLLHGFELVVEPLG